VKAMAERYLVRVEEEWVDMMDVWFVGYIVYCFGWGYAEGDKKGGFGKEDEKKGEERGKKKREEVRFVGMDPVASFEET
jgi:hypothetical protein